MRITYLSFPVNVEIILIAGIFFLSHAHRNCAFVNFTNIQNAIKAIEGVKNKPDYANLRIAHGKDRCANPPRAGPQGAGGMRRSASGTSNSNANANNGTFGGASPNAALELEGGVKDELELGEEGAYAVGVDAGVYGEDATLVNGVEVGAVDAL